MGSGWEVSSELEAFIIDVVVHFLRLPISKRPFKIQFVGLSDLPPLMYPRALLRWLWAGFGLQKRCLQFWLHLCRNVELLLGTKEEVLLVDDD